MKRGCRSFKKGDIVKGLLITVDPYKTPGDKNYRSLVKCTLCNSDPYEIVLSEINRHVFDGCGCQTSRKHSYKWKTFEDWCKENNREDILDLWDYDLNDKLPSEISYCTSDVYYLKCALGKHESEPHNISYITRQSINKRLCAKCNSFAQYAIDTFGENVLEMYWDYSKNTVSPWEISHASTTEVWIKCIDVDYHGSYLILPNLFLQGVRCPYCHKNKVHPLDSLAHYHIQKYGEDFLDLYWDYDMNTVDPWSIAPQSNVHIYLKCDIHGTHKMSAFNFYKHGTTCGECVRERGKSKLQEKVENYILCNYDCKLTHEYNCTIIPKNPKTKRLLPYDNDVELSNHVHLIVEVMGEQHYNELSGLIRRHAKREGLTPKQVLVDIQWRDEYKKQYALSQGYYYISIPYWAEQDESYKTLIDKKISEILSITAQN